MCETFNPITARAKTVYLHQSGLNLFTRPLSLYPNLFVCDNKYELGMLYKYVMLCLVKISFRLNVVDETS